MELKFGDKGLVVNELQRRLFYAGYKTIIDGFFGERTVKTIREIQKRFGLIPTGIFDYRVNEILSDRSAAFFLKEKELLELSSLYSIEPSLLAALIETYSIKEYSQKNKLHIVFKRDLFYQLLKSAKYDVVSLSKQHPNIINRERGGYLGGHAEHLRLTKALAINEKLAYKSSLYGIFEVPGTAYKSCGFETIEDFVREIKHSEKSQVKIFLEFLEKNNLLPLLRQSRFTDFFKKYDKNYYYNFSDISLSRVFEKYQILYPLEVKKTMETVDAEAS